MQEAGLSRQAPPRAGEAGPAIWAGRIAMGVAALALGTALGRADDPALLVVGAVLAALAVAAAVARLRWSLVAALFLLVAYVPDTLAHRSVAHGLTAIVLAGALLRWATGRERFALPRELLAVRRPRPRLPRRLRRRRRSWRRRGRDARPGQLRPDRRAADDPARHRPSGCGARCGRSRWASDCSPSWRSSSRSPRPTARPTAASPECCPRATPCAAPARSTRIPFGQVLVTSAVLAFYLARMQTRTSARVFAAAICAACVVAAVYTQSRAALIALVIAAVVIALLHGVRLRSVALALLAVVALGSLVVPNSLQERIGALRDATGSDSSTASFRDNASLRGRTSENLAGVQMWGDHPLLGVGPDNFEVHYQTYSAEIGLDPRAAAAQRAQPLPGVARRDRPLRRDRVRGRALAGPERRVAGPLAAPGPRRPARRGPRGGAGRLPDLRGDPAQLLRPLRVGLHRRSASPPGAWRGGRRGDRGPRGGDRVRRPRGVGVRRATRWRSSCSGGCARARGGAPTSSCRCRWSSPPTTRWT